MAKKRSAETNYNTHLASEFLMMSLLNRKGKDAYLSMGNKKGVDIIVRTKKGAICVVEVKGLNKQNDWLITTKGELPVADNLFYALICFHGQIDNLDAKADFWLIPSHELNKKPPVKVSENKVKTVYVQYTYVRDNYQKYLNKFDWLELYLDRN